MMISRSLFAAVWLASSALAAPPLTTIQDVLYKADGTRFNGTLTISWTSFEAVDTSAITTQTTTVTVVAGNLRVQLVPTTTAAPAASYTVKYNSDGRITFSETWAVPSSVQPLRVRDVRIASTQAGLASADAVVTPVQESDVFGLVPDLGARPLKGPGYAAGRVALVNPSGSLESVTGSPSDCVRVDGSSGPCGGGGGGGAQPSFVDGDSPTGIVDGSNTTFTLSAVPNPSTSLALYRNGMLQKAAQDFTANGNAIQFVAAAAPQPGDTLLASYRLTGTDTGSPPQYLVSPQQINPAGLTAGQAWLWNGSSYVAGDVGNGGVASTGSYSNPAWIASLAWSKITGVPPFVPAAHASTHAAAGSDPVTLASIGAAPVANPVFTGNVTVGATVLDPVLGLTDPLPAVLPKWRLAQAKMRNGLKDAKILCIGDSTTAGYGSSTMGTVPEYAAYPMRLVSLLDSAAPGLAIFPSDLNATGDTRWSIGAGWTQVNQGFAGVTGMTGGLSGALVFTPGAVQGNYDSFDVYFNAYSGVSGILTITATGGTPIIVNTRDGHLSNGVHFVTVTAGSASTTNSVSITGATANTFVLGVDPWLSTAKRIRVGNAGATATTTTQWASGSVGDSGSTSSIRAYAPDLSIIMLGINDAVAGVSSATVQANLTTIVTAARISGDVILATMVPSSSGGTGTPQAVAFEAQYQPIFASLASGLGLPLINIYSRFGGAYQAQYMTDGLHPNDYGYWDIAAAVNAFLRRIQ